MRLVWLYTRCELVESLRAPGSFLTITLMPLTVMLFFIVPNLDDDPGAITGATATMVVFATLLACVGHFSTTVAMLRESAWGSYLRTLPTGLRPLVLSNLLTGMVVVVAAVIPIVLVGALFTAADASAAGLLGGFAALLVTVVVFTVMGLAVGYTMSLRMTTIVNSIFVLALAVGGGMFFDPNNPPPMVETIAPLLPTRGTTDLVLAALTDHSADPLALAMLVPWTVALAGLTVWGYRRDEGRRFR
jgi:ABC-2 type transport system permease protein